MAYSLIKTQILFKKKSEHVKYSDFYAFYLMRQLKPILVSTILFLKPKF